MGRVLFDVPISDIKKVLELRTVDNIWVIHGATIGKLKRKRINFAKVKVPVNHRIFVISDLDLTQTEEESIGKLTEFVLDQIDWKKGLDAWNRIFVSDPTK